MASVTDSMNNPRYYSIRMRASLQDRHVSGGEKIVSADALDKTAAELMARARTRSVQPDSISITVDRLRSIPTILKALDLVSTDYDSVSACRSRAKKALLSAGIAAQAISEAFGHLINGPAPSGANMRGAMILDAATGSRLEPDRERGVRASRLDWTDETGTSIRRELEQNGLPHFRTYEALAVATKIAHGPGVLAELCWSDDPDYTAGYVASLRNGYLRLPFMKETGDAKGGRAIFVDFSDQELNPLIQYLQCEPVLIGSMGMVVQDSKSSKFSDRTSHVRTGN